MSYLLIKFTFIILTNIISVSFYPRPDNLYTTLGEAPLKGKGGTYTVGYGDIGGIPLAFALQENQNIDIGFIKIFLSTTPVDLSAMPQPSPFEGTRSGKTYHGRPVVETWATILFPIVQLRNPRISDIAKCPECDSFSPNCPTHNGKDQLESGNADRRKELADEKEQSEPEIKRLQARNESLKSGMESEQTPVLVRLYLPKMMQIFLRAVQAYINSYQTI